MTEPTSIEDIKNALPGYMDEYRLKHTLGVWKECQSLGEIFGKFPDVLSADDRRRLEIAGLLHDISKEKSYEEQLALCRNYEIKLDRFQSASKSVLHQTTGAYLAQALFGKTTVDDGIFDAISCHTTGREHMLPFDCMLFLADYMEAGRTFTSCVLLRESFYGGLDGVRDDREKLLMHLGVTMVQALDTTILDLTRGGKLIDSRTIACRNDLIYRHNAATKTGMSLFSVSVEHEE